MYRVQQYWSDTPLASGVILSSSPPCHARKFDVQALFFLGDTAVNILPKTADCIAGGDG